MLWRGKSHSTPMFTLLKIHQQFIFKLFLRLTFLFLLALTKFLVASYPRMNFFTFKGLIKKKKKYVSDYLQPAKAKYLTIWPCCVSNVL